MMNRLNRANRRHERSTSNAVMSASPHSEAQTWNRYQGSGRGNRESERQDLEDAREDMEVLREYIHDLAEDARQIQPEEEDG